MTVRASYTVTETEAGVVKVRDRYSSPVWWKSRAGIIASSNTHDICPPLFPELLLLTVRRVWAPVKTAIAVTLPLHRKTDLC